MRISVPWQNSDEDTSPALALWLIGFMSSREPEIRECSTFPNILVLSWFISITSRERKEIPAGDTMFGSSNLS